MKRQTLLRFLLLFLTLTTAYSFKELNTIQDLKSLDNNSLSFWLRLLYWLASKIQQNNNNNVIRLTTPNVYKTLGAHPYHNYENMLPTIPRDERYFSLGNLNDDYGDEPIPPYVINDYNNLKPSQKVWRNRQRIILEVTSDQVYSVYITQHYPYRNEYDPANTYIITPNFLREIQTLQTASASDIQEQWGINVSERDIQTDNGRIYVILRWLKSVIRNDNGICLMPKNRKRKHRDVSDDDCDNLNIDLDLGTTDTGNARIQWSNIPQKYVAEGAMLALYKNSDTPLNYIEVTTDSGRYDTSTSLDAGMQVRLHKESYEVVSGWFKSSQKKVPGEVIWRGPRFHDANSVNPVTINNYDAYLQLFVSDGYASARLYIKNSFTEWKDVFRDSWVGFYANDNKNTLSQYKYQWAVKFNKVSQPDMADHDIPHYDVYVYKSNMLMSHGVQARFMLTKSEEELGRTEPWQLKPPAPVDINGYEARLQLYNTDGRASARLLIKKTFNNWKNIFDYSWVGFYSDETNNYGTWQWVVRFTEEIRSDFPDYDVYVYKSGMSMSHGVQARFMLTKAGEEKARTLPWSKYEDGVTENDELRK